MLKCSFFTVLCSIFKDAETGKSSLFLFYKIDVFFLLYTYIYQIYRQGSTSVTNV